jgi:hypothetical protein
VEIVTVDPVNRTTTFDQVKYCRHRRIVCLRALLARRPSATGRIAAPQLETTRCWSPSTDNAINGRKSRLSRSNRTCQSLRYSTHAPLSRPRVYSVRDLQIRTSPWSVDRELRSKGRGTVRNRNYFLLSRGASAPGAMSLLAGPSEAASRRRCRRARALHPTSRSCRMPRWRPGALPPRSEETGCWNPNLTAPSPGRSRPKSNGRAGPRLTSLG